MVAGCAWLLDVCGCWMCVVAGCAWLLDVRGCWMCVVAGCADWMGVVLNMHARQALCGMGMLDGCGAR